MSDIHDVLSQLVQDLPDMTGRSRSTIKTYLWDVLCFSRVVDETDIEKLFTLRNLQLFVLRRRKQGVKDATIKRQEYGIRFFWKHLYIQQICQEPVPSSDALDFRLRNDNEHVRPLPEEVWQQLLKGVNRVLERIV